MCKDKCDSIIFSHICCLLTCFHSKGVKLERSFWDTLLRQPDGLEYCLFKFYLLFAVLLSFKVCSLNRLLRHPRNGQGWPKIRIRNSYYTGSILIIILTTTTLPTSMYLFLQEKGEKGQTDLHAQYQRRHKEVAHFLKERKENALLLI